MYRVSHLICITGSGGAAHVAEKEPKQHEAPSWLRERGNSSDGHCGPECGRRASSPGCGVLCRRGLDRSRKNTRKGGPALSPAGLLGYQRRSPRPLPKVATDKRATAARLCEPRGCRANPRSALLGASREWRPARTQAHASSCQ